MKAEDAKRLKELDKENGQLKRIVADKELEILAHKEISKGRMKVKFALWLGLVFGLFVARSVAVGNQLPVVVFGVRLRPSRSTEGCSSA